MTEHSFYANNLVDALLEEGIPSEQIWELDGWKENQRSYYWTDIHTNRHNGYDGVANGHLNHHTASSSYVPYVKSSTGKTKATAFLGVRDGNRLYQNRLSGVPTIALTSAGPANYSAGSGVKDYIKKLDASEAALKQLNRDDDPKFYGNRYVLNTEIVCDGVGGKINEDSWDLLMLYNAALSRLHDADEHWNGFHAGFTRRKIDYRDGRYANAPMTIEQMWVEIAHILGNDPVIPPEPPTQGEHDMNTVKYSDGFRASREKQATVKALQIMLADRNFADDNTQDGTCAADGMFGRGTERSVKAFQGSKGLSQSGICDAATWDALEGWES